MKSFVIHIKEDSFKTDEIFSKEEGYKIITQLKNSGKITAINSSALIKEIIDAEELPWSEQKKDSVYFMNNPFVRTILIHSAIAALIDMTDSLETVEVAYLKMCDRCHLHGKIYTKNCYTDSLGSKEEAFLCLNELKSMEYVTEEEFRKVTTEIQASTLPDIQV